MFTSLSKNVCSDSSRSCYFLPRVACEAASASIRKEPGLAGPAPGIRLFSRTTVVEMLGASLAPQCLQMDFQNIHPPLLAALSARVSVIQRNLKRKLVILMIHYDMVYDNTI